MVGDAGEQVKRTDMTHDSRGTMRHGERTKSTQTTTSLPARATGAKLRLLLALISVITLLATMFVTGPFQARVAEAADAGICTPVHGVIGDGQHAKVHDDPGIATWVGRDMYVGAPKEDGSTRYDKDTLPEPSYAVEAEGLTAINGKLITRSIKNGWHNYGFRFGSVGFGAMMTPKEKADVLAVAGQNSAVRLIDTKGQSVNVLGWGDKGRSHIRWDEHGPAHDGRIASPDGNPSKAHDVQGIDVWGLHPNTEDSVYAFDKWNGNNSYISWIKSTDSENKPVNVLETVQLNEPYAESAPPNSTDISKTTEHIRALSKTLVSLNSVAQGMRTELVNEAKSETNFIRSKYDNKDYTVTFNIGDHQERIIKFIGDGKHVANTNTYTGSLMQVFNLPADWLIQSADFNGISFMFENIPDQASVVVNVMGDENNTVDFHNGWRFWWNGEDISGYYATEGYIDDDKSQGELNSDAIAQRNKTYSKVSSSLMWNFPNTKKLIVRGGKITADQNATVRKGSETKSPATVDDDPVANMLGSVLVPYGSFESHVSTNGRVWVGEDYMMYNPTGLKEYAELNKETFKDGHTENVISASLIAQDQERHNFSWSGEISTSCAVLEWQKVNQDGERLGGTEWGVYRLKDDAREGKNALVTVSDDSQNDWAIGTNGQGVGKFQVRRLNPNATYYIKELKPAPGYAINPVIYALKTGSGAEENPVVNGGFPDGQPSTPIFAAYRGSDGAEILNLDDKPNSVIPDEAMLSQGSIINRELPSVEWEKVDSETGALLGGSEWRLYKKQVENGTTTYPVIKESITDAYGTMVYLDTKTAKWPADGGVTETPKIHYKIGKCGDWTVSEMTPYGNGIYGVYVPGRGQNVKFSFFLGTVSYKASEYRPDGPADNFSSGPNVQYVTVRSKNQAVEPTQPTTSLQGPEYTDLDMRQGKFKLGGLTEGEYTLQETKAPEGYWLPNEGGSYYTFKVESQNGQYTISWIASNITVNGQTIQTTQAATTATSGVTVGKISNTPTKVTWEKVDSTDKKALAGSTWTLKRGESVLAEVSDCTSGNCETGIYKDQNNAAGKFMLKRLPAGTYKLQEATAPTGYQLSETVYEFTIPQTEPNTAEVKVSANPIGNDRKLGIVKFEKVAEGTLNRLSGSEWELTFKPQGSEEDRTKWKTVPITDCTEGNPTCSADSIDRDVVPGKFQIKSLTAPYGNNNLEWGTYELRETKAPDGYNLSDRVYTFTVDKDHLESIKLYVNGQEVSGNRIGNEPGVVLPVTGAEGRHLWPAIVGALFVLAAFGCAVALRMRE